ncbi:MAG: BMC domain-containing protein [Chitinivibrionales bacterium]|nr:BMC domain-containing protein [Chitinivibrionales bacterium]
MSSAIGMVESKGMVGLVAAGDAMCKAANVRMIKMVSIGGGFATTLVTGDVGSVRSAVDAGVQALKTAGGELVGSHVIPQPNAVVTQNFIK